MGFRGGDLSKDPQLSQGQVKTRIPLQPSSLVYNSSPLSVVSDTQSAMVQKQMILLTWSEGQRHAHTIHPTSPHPVGITSHHHKEGGHSTIF